MNGALFNPRPEDWNETQEGLGLQTTLASANLRRGLNSVECSVSNGQGTLLRQSVVFIFQTQPALQTAMRIETRESRFGNSQNQTESLVLTNRGSINATLTGWSIFNEKRQRFTFPVISLKSGESVKIYSGFTEPTQSSIAPSGASATGKGDKIFLWNSSPIWRDTGDTVVIVDDQGVQRLTYSYGDRE